MYLIKIGIKANKISYKIYMQIFSHFFNKQCLRLSTLYTNSVRNLHLANRKMYIIGYRYQKPIRKQSPLELIRSR